MLGHIDLELGTKENRFEKAKDILASCSRRATSSSNGKRPDGTYINPGIYKDVCAVDTANNLGYPVPYTRDGGYSVLQVAEWLAKYGMTLEHVLPDPVRGLPTGKYLQEQLPKNDELLGHAKALYFQALDNSGPPNIRYLPRSLITSSPPKLRY